MRVPLPVPLAALDYANRFSFSRGASSSTSGNDGYGSIQYPVRTGDCDCGAVLVHVLAKLGLVHYYNSPQLFCVESVHLSFIIFIPLKLSLMYGYLVHGYVPVYLSQVFRSTTKTAPQLSSCLLVSMLVMWQTVLC